MAEVFRSFNPDVTGWQFMWLLVIPAVFAVAISIERMIYIMIKSDINAAKFMSQIRKYVVAHEFGKAIELCRMAKERALPKVVACGLRAAAENDPVDFRTVQNAVDEGMLEVIPRLQERTNYLAMIANIATLLGLLGTIYGLIIAFRSISAPGIDATEKARLLSAGISTAMNTTLVGLSIAIPTIFFYTFLVNKTNKIIDEIDEHMVKLINLLTGNR
ncbi:MotA/TolQ/ExbB proton channel family protein [candidate division KSB1 bacterium]|nr:MotA/TolQ/ExbB proton channel family protein [candidate division KSB1 bacterium]